MYGTSPKMSAMEAKVKEECLLSRSRLRKLALPRQEAELKCLIQRAGLAPTNRIMPHSGFRRQTQCGMRDVGLKDENN